MTPHDFRCQPLSNRIVTALLEATEAYTTMNVLLKEYPTYAPLLTEILDILDIYHHIQNESLDVGVEQVVHEFYIPIPTSPVQQYVDVMQACTEYALKRIEFAEVLTAGDVLKINKAISDKDTRCLSVHDVPPKLTSYIETIWKVLHELYNPKRQSPFLLETAFACYQLMVIFGNAWFRIETLVLLFSSLYQNNLAFSGMVRQWILTTDPKLSLSDLDMEDAIIHILTIFKNMWEHTINIIRAIISARVAVRETIQAQCPQLSSDDLIRLLGRRICIRIHDV